MRRQKGIEDLVNDGELAVDWKNTPKFNRPPVVETVLGVQFKPLLKLQPAHYGLFWNLIRDQGFRDSEQHPPLEHVIEKSGPDLTQFSFSFSFGRQGPITATRVWFLASDSSEGQQLIQLQPDRLVQNWRALDPEKTKYISFESSKKSFEDTFKKFADFVKKEDLGSIEIDQCEVIYVNQIPIASSAGEAFESTFQFFEKRSTQLFDKAACDCTFENSYWINAIQGKLHVTASTVLVRDLKAKAIDFRLVARGAPTSSSLEDVLSWLDKGHYFTVNAFADLTKDEMHKHWERHK